MMRNAIFIWEQHFEKKEKKNILEFEKSKENICLVCVFCEIKSNGKKI